MSRKAEQERNELVIRELQKKLEDQKNLTEEMKRKQEQGSMQLQGEIQELAIEEWLVINFPLDTITEIKKGAQGADCIQTVNTHSRVNCGSIYYESKRAMMKIWSAREKQIDKVITNTTSMYGSIKGIGGMAIGTVQALELGQGKEEDNS